MLFKASAPGSLMLLGEYAVLHGGQALVCAVDKRMQVQLSPRNDSIITIQSALGYYETTLSQLQVVAPFQFVLTVLQSFKKKLTQGCDITIESEFSNQIGFASSAAVTVALLSALSAWLNLSLPPIKMVTIARRIVRKVQGLGSGADVAACVFGGILGYRATPLQIHKESYVHPLTVVYSGSKTPTVQAVNYVKNKFISHEKLFQKICHAINQCTLDGLDAVKNQQWECLGAVMDVQQGLLDSLGVSTSLLSDMVCELRQQEKILGAKISGSGLGDCVIGLGAVHENFATQLSDRGAMQIQASITTEGVWCEKN